MAAKRMFPKKHVRFLNATTSIEHKLCDAIHLGDYNAVRNCLSESVKGHQGFNPVDVCSPVKKIGMSPIHFATGLAKSPSQLGILRMLLEYGADPNISNHEGVTPVHIAASWGNTEGLKILMEFGGDPSLEDGDGKNAWDLALQETHWSTLRYLESVEGRTLANEAFLSSSNCSSFSLGLISSDAEESALSANGSVALVDEYLYTDDDEGVQLLERRFPSWVGSASPDSPDERSALNDAVLSDTKSSTASDSLESMLSDQLRDELKIYGEDPGPITSTTKRPYLRLLGRLRRHTLPTASTSIKPQTHYPAEIRRCFLQFPLPATEANIGLELETMMTDSLSKRDVAWREGMAKHCFNYLLLDPRSLGSRELIHPEEQFRNFISSIFYVGKGQRSRPYEHLYEAVKTGDLNQANPKITKIREIWESGCGVVSLHVFHNTIPVEAYTREAAMIEALGLRNLTNLRNGDFYGAAAAWFASDKRKLGLHLLIKAFHILSFEGERQLKQADLKL